MGVVRYSTVRFLRTAAPWANATWQSHSAAVVDRVTTLISRRVLMCGSLRIGASPVESDADECASCRLRNDWIWRKGPPLPTRSNAGGAVSGSHATPTPSEPIDK